MTDKYDVDLSGARWFTSTRTSGGKDCVEVAHLDGGMVGVRDSKNLTGPALIFTPGEWDAFTSGVNDGEFDRPRSDIGSPAIRDCKEFERER